MDSPLSHDRIMDEVHGKSLTFSIQMEMGCTAVEMGRGGGAGRLLAKILPVQEVWWTTEKVAVKKRYSDGDEIYLIFLVFIRLA